MAKERAFLCVCFPDGCHEAGDGMPVAMVFGGVPKYDVDGDRAHMLEQALWGLRHPDRLAPSLLRKIMGGVHREGEQIDYHRHTGKAALAMAESVIDGAAGIPPSDS